MGLNSRKKERQRRSVVRESLPEGFKTDFPVQILVTSGHTTVWQNIVTLQVSCLAMLQRRL